MEPCGADVPSTAIEKLLNKRKYLKLRKLKIAQNSSSILQDPNENIGRLSDLTKLAVDPLFMKSKSLRRLLIASLCVVYKDILPTYKIRLPTEQELKQKVKKETKRTWRFEEILLKNYEKYVLLIQTILKDKERRKLPKSIRIYSAQNWSKAEFVCALKCACTLFENNPLFNFANDLLGAFMPYLQRSKAPIRQIVFKCLKATFASDVTGEPTLMVCRSVHKVARNVNYRIHPDVANVIAGIVIKEVNDPSINAKKSRKDRKFVSRRERKKDKLLAKFEKDQAETKASKSHDERLKMNSEILKEILFVYFKVLKTTRDSNLLSAVLAGLSTYAHIINVEYVENLLQLMSNFIANPKTSLHDGLHSVHTALTILNTSSAASVLKVDPTRFYNHLYALLGYMAGVCSNKIASNDNMDKVKNLLQYSWARTPAALASQALTERERFLSRSGDNSADSYGTTDAARSIDSGEVDRFTDVILGCLDMLLISRRRETPTTRVLAFVKRLTSLTLVVGDTPSLACILVSLWKFLSLFPKCEVLFDSDTEIGGPYDPEAIDPELARPASASLWELNLLRIHESPLIRKIISVILKWSRQISKDGTVRPTKEIIAAQDQTLESLSVLKPDERRLLLAHTEATCLSKPTTTKPSKQQAKQLPPWLKNAAARLGVATTDSCTSLDVAMEVDG